MQPGASFACCDFWRESHIESHLESEIADNPFGQHQLVGSFFGSNREEFDFVLLIVHPFKSEIADLGMAVFDAPAGLGYILHAFRPEFVELGIWC